MNTAVAMTQAHLIMNALRRDLVRAVDFRNVRMITLGRRLWYGEAPERVRQSALRFARLRSSELH